MKTIWRWLAGDALKLGKNETYLEELIIQLGKTVTTPVSAQMLCSNTNIGSHNTVTEYLKLLVSCFALRVCYAIDLDNGSYRFKKNRKFYFTDPLMFWLSQEMSGKIVEDSGLPKVAEQVAHEALSYKYKRFGYFSTEQGEIDFISPKNWALEVKWAPFAHNLSKAFLKNQSPTKIVWTQENFLLHWP